MKSELARAETPSFLNQFVADYKESGHLLASLILRLLFAVQLKNQRITSQHFLRVRFA